MNAMKRFALSAAAILVVVAAAPVSAQTSAHGHKHKKQPPAHKNATHHHRKAATHAGSQNLGNTNGMAQRPYETGSKTLKAADRQLQQLSHNL